MKVKDAVGDIIKAVCGYETFNVSVHVGNVLDRNNVDLQVIRFTAGSPFKISLSCRVPTLLKKLRRGNLPTHSQSVRAFYNGAGAIFCSGDIPTSGTIEDAVARFEGDIRMIIQNISEKTLESGIDGSLVRFRANALRREAADAEKVMQNAHKVLIEDD